MPGARRMDRNSREYIRGTAQRPGKRGQIELVYVKEQWAPPVSFEQDNDDGAARKRERPRRKFLDVLRADIQEVKYGNQWFAVWSEEKLKCNLSALLTLAVLHSSLKCISYSVIHMRTHTHTRAHTELQCKAATGATSCFQHAEQLGIKTPIHHNPEADSQEAGIITRPLYAVEYARWAVCVRRKIRGREIVWRKNIEITKSESWHWHQNPSPTNNLIQNVIDTTSDSSVLWNARWTLFPVGATVQWQQWEWTEGPRISCIKHVWLSAAPLSAAR